jgi:excisionase family DNA binding protein
MPRTKKRPVGTPDVSPEIKLLNVTQTAELTCSDTDTVRKWMASGQLKFLRLGPHGIRIRVSELERFLQAFEQEVKA